MKPSTITKSEQVAFEWIAKDKLFKAVQAMSFHTGESVEDIVKFLTDDGGLTKLMLAYFCEGGKK